MGFGTTANKPVAQAAEPAHKGNGPVDKIKFGGITVDVWENSGEHSKFYTFTLQRSYKQGNEWKNTNSLRAQDLPKAILALQKAYEQSLSSEQEDKE
jgi:hypothetical protein